MIYQTSFLFRKTETTRLRRSIPRLVDSIDTSLECAITIQQKGSLVTIKGTKLSLQNRAVRKVEDVIKRNGRDFSRGLDSGGDAIRRSLFTPLGEIEQELRRFIERGMFEVSSQWWARYIAPPLKEEIEKRKEKNPKGEPDPLAWLTFQELVDLVTHNYSQWNPEKSLTPEELLELLEGISTTSELKTRLKEKINPRSLWDEVFSKFFEDREEWEKMKGKLGVVIGIRNQVMHHRPVAYTQIAQVKNVRKELSRLVNTAKTNLTQTEKRQASSELRQSHLGAAIIPNSLGVLPPGAGTLGSLMNDESLTNFARTASQVSSAINSPAFASLSQSMQTLSGSGLLEFAKQVSDTRGAIANSLSGIGDLNESLARTLTGALTARDTLASFGALRSQENQRSDENENRL